MCRIGLCDPSALCLHPENEAPLFLCSAGEAAPYSLEPLPGFSPHSLAHAGTCSLTQYCLGAGEQGVDASAYVLSLWDACLP